MYAVPAGWAARLVVPHAIRTQATLYAYGNPVLTLPQPLAAPAPKVTYDLTSNTGATMECAFDSAELAAVAAMDLLGGLALEPAGNEVSLAATIDDGQGGWFPWVPLGQFGITANSRLDSSAAVGPLVKISGRDRSQVIGASHTKATAIVAAGTPIEAAIARLFTDQIPWIRHGTYMLEGAGVLLPKQIIAVDADPWQVARRWATSNGLILRLDRSGAVILHPFVAPATPTYRWGSGDGTLISTNPSFDITNSHNGITVIGSYPGIPPVRATLYDNDASSPTYADGLFGHRPAPTRTYATIASIPAANRACALLLPSVLGLARTLLAESPLDVSVDAGDIIQVTDPRSPQATGPWQASQLGLTLDGATPMTMTGIPLGQALADAVVFGV